MKTIYMAVTVELIVQQQQVELINMLNASKPVPKETKDGIRYVVL